MAKFDCNISDKPHVVISYAISKAIGHCFNSETKCIIDMLHSCFLLSDELSLCIPLGLGKRGKEMNKTRKVMKELH